MTGCIGGKRYLRPQVLDRCQDCWKGGNVLGSSWTWCYKGEQSRDGVVFSINPSEVKMESLDAGRHKNWSSRSCRWWKSWGRSDLGRSRGQYKTAMAECRNSCVLNEPR